MFRYFFLSSLILCISCNNKIKSSELDLLNGYWSIEYITHKNETFYPKGVTKLLDFYEVNDREGIRKKTQPQLNNKFLVTKDLNKFKESMWIDDEEIEKCDRLLEDYDCLKALPAKWDKLGKPKIQALYKPRCGVLMPQDPSGKQGLSTDAAGCPALLSTDVAGCPALLFSFDRRCSMIFCRSSRWSSFRLKTSLMPSASARLSRTMSHISVPRFSMV